METSLHLDRSSAEPLYRQLYDQIRDAILSHRLPPGSRLPSSRELAGRLGVGRITVTTAYERLVAEGYAQSRIGAWTAVVSSVPDQTSANSRRRFHQHPRSAAPIPLPLHLQALLHSTDISLRPRERVEYDFRYMGSAFPMIEWRRMVSRHWVAHESGRKVAESARGELRLRRQIALYLRTARASNCTPEQIVVTSNVEHAFDIISHVVLERGDRVLMEDPGFLGSRLIFQTHGAEIVPVPVDADGVDPVVVRQLGDRRTRLLYLTPSHQYPTGATLSLPRRLRLLDWAAAQGVLLIEDDQNSEYRYGGVALESLQGLDTYGVVVYVGTFRKIVGGAVRVSYLVVSPHLVEPVAAIQTILDKGPPIAVQTALAEFMETGLFRRHQRRMQRIHRSRRDVLFDALREHFGDGVEIGATRAGHHLHVRWRDHPAGESMIQAALDAQIGLSPVAPLYLNRAPSDPGVMMAYGGLDEAKIRTGIRKLAGVLRRR